MGSGFSKSCKLQSDEKTVKQRKEKPRHPPENWEELEERRLPEKPLSSSSRKVRDDPQVITELCERKWSGHEGPRRAPLPRISGEVFLSTESDDREAGSSSHRTRDWEKHPRHQDRLSPRSSPKAGAHCKEAAYGRERGQGERRERKHRPRTPSFPESEEQLHLHDTGNRGIEDLVARPGIVYTYKLMYLVSNLFLGSKSGAKSYIRYFLSLK